MDENDTQTRTDGGAEEVSPFEVTASYEQTQLEIFQQQFDAWVVTPARILWDDYRGRFGILIVTIYVLAGTIGPRIVPAPSPNMGPRLLVPFENPQYLLGTDGLGQGLLSLMVHATPAMLKMIIAGAIFGNLLGVSLGLISGYMGGTTDKAIMTVADTLRSIPGLPLLIVLAAIIQPQNPFLIGIMLSIQRWAGQARNLRSQVLPLADEGHVEAARAVGHPTSNLLTREILPHLLPLIFIGFLGGATQIIFASVGLYFLGILPFTVQNWGVVLNFAYQNSGALYSLDAAHWLLVPLFTIVGLTLSLTLLAQAFDQVFNPRVRARHRARDQAPPETGREEDEFSATDVNQMDTTSQ